jgi:UDP-glucose 4-epimerase
VPVLLASNDRAKEILGWELKYSDIETIIRTAWKWHSFVTAHSQE